MAHFFTPEEANKVLPRVKALVSRAMELKIKLDHSAGKSRSEALDELSLTMAKIEEIGAEMKDLDIGLIDFPAMKFNEPVSLCWKMGEGEILYWHGISEGYRGRKLLKPEEAHIG